MPSKYGSNAQINFLTAARPSCCGNRTRPTAEAATIAVRVVCGWVIMATSPLSGIAVRPGFGRTGQAPGSFRLEEFSLIRPLANAPSEQKIRRLAAAEGSCQRQRSGRYCRRGAAPSSLVLPRWIALLIEFRFVWRKVFALPLVDERDPSTRPMRQPCQPGGPPQPSPRLCE